MLPVLHFVADPHTLVRLCINFTKLNFQFFSVNVEIVVRNVTINDVQLQNWNLEFGIPPISYAIHKVISNKNSTLMESNLLNKRGKFGAKIFRHY